MGIEINLDGLIWNYIDINKEGVNRGEKIYIMDTLVTQAHYTYVKNINPSFFVNADNPVENVSWYDAMLYAYELKQKYIKTGAVRGLVDLRLPTESEWEYAYCCGGEDEWENEASTETANFDGEYYLEFDPGAESKGSMMNRTTPVKTYRPNKLGIYDLRGNVWDMCLDAYFKNSKEMDGTGALVASKIINKKFKEDLICQEQAYRKVYGDMHFLEMYENKVKKGGGYESPWDLCACNSRERILPNVRQNYMGFRLVMVTNTGDD